ncbi:MAG: methyl-accepting chemotaxis protein [Candidatus Velthaea sp.]
MEASNIAVPAGSGEERLSMWLLDVARSRDLACAVPAASGVDVIVAQKLRAFLAQLRWEMTDFRSIVDAAAETAALNAQQLETIVANTAEQNAVVQRAAAAIAEVDRGAAHVAGTAEELRALTATVATATTSYDAGVAAVLGGLDALASTVEDAAGSARLMERRSAGIVAFLEQLRRIARQARLLGINAAIEAAHLGDAGSGFIIVADEVKKLASSTAESAHDVDRIEKQIQSASGGLQIAIREASTIVRDLAHDVQSARDRSAETGQQVRELAQAVTGVAEIASGQSMKLSGIADGVAQSAQYAQKCADAAQRASRLDVSGALERLRIAVTMYRLGDAVQARRESVDLETLPGIVRDACMVLRTQVDDDQREILGLITRLAVVIARNSYEWLEIGASLGSLRAQLETTSHGVEVTAEGARGAAVASQQMRTALNAMRVGFASSVEALDHSLRGVARVHETVQHAESSVTATAAATERAGAILELIDTISSETILLSFNAAIEAAHAGIAGSGFGVIADEIRKLADTTFAATQEIAGVLGGLAEASQATTQTTTLAVTQTQDVHAQTAAMQTVVADLRHQLEETLGRAGQVASIVEQQLQALSEARSAAGIALQTVENDSASATDGRRIELANLGMRAHALAARRPLGTTAEEIRRIGLSVAVDMDGIFRDTIARGMLRVDDCFDTSYEELTGASIQKLGRLFDVSKVPERGFDPPKFETRYDRFVEDGINALIDAAVPSHPAIKAMFAVDLNGFCFGHYHECRRAWTGDRVTDLNHNRIKRFFDDALSLRCSRVGLGEHANGLPRRTAYATFRETGCALKREGDRPWTIYTYARDTGIVYNDLSVALFAQDSRVGTVRIVYDADAV